MLSFFLFRRVSARCSPRQVMFVALALASASGHAGNGLNLIGFGIESNLLAGADVATARDTGALNTNPAGLNHTRRRALDLHFGVGDPFGMTHKDQLGNDLDADNSLIPVANFGHAQRLSGKPLTLGFGSFAQGGAGNRYKNMNTGFGTRDELSSQFRIGKIMSGLAYQATDKLSVGASLALSVSDLRQKIFPGTSVVNPLNPAQSFFGSKLTDARAISPGIRLGAQYRLNDALTLGAVYGNKTKLKLKDGELRVNMSALGIGEVKYEDVQVSGLALPQELGFGVAWQASDAWLVSFKLTWLDWSGALQSSTLRASKPNHPAAPPTIRNRATLDWRDQYVTALGVAYRLSERTTLLAGYNHGKNPIPTRTLSPLLGTFAEDHVTVGVIRRLNDQWQFAGGIEYDFKRTIKSNNPELPFGPGARDSGELIALHLGLSRRW